MVVTFVLGSLAYTCLSLDRLRLNKQAIEARQIIRALTRSGVATPQVGLEARQGFTLPRRSDVDGLTREEEEGEEETHAAVVSSEADDADDDKPKKRIGWIHHPAVLMWRGYIPALKY